MSLECVDMYAPTPFIAKGERLVMGTHPKGNYYLYPSTKTIVIRNIEDPKKCDVYTGHNANTTVAKYAPPYGSHICSGDSKGKIRIWDTSSSEHKLKNEFDVLSGAIRDLDWDFEGKRIVLCGLGRETFGKAIMWDTGVTLGTIDHATRGGNSITCKPNRPMRVALGTEGKEVVFYKGPPFKFSKTLDDYKNFVQSVRFSPDGQFLASACMGGRLFLSDGKEADKTEELVDGAQAHTAGINAIWWSHDSEELLSVSGDKTAKIWNVKKKECVQKFVMGTEEKDQQKSCLWKGEHLLTVSYSGDINYLDRNNPSKPLKVIHGHNTEVMRVFVLDENTFLTGDSSGKILKWNVETGEATMFSGKGHRGKVIGLCCDSNSNKMVSLGWDDKILFTCLSSMDYSTCVVEDLGSQPINLFPAGCGTYVVLTQKEIWLIQNEKKVFSLPHEKSNYNDDDIIPTSIAATAGRVAVGSHKNEVTIYSIENDRLEKLTEFEAPAVPTNMAFSRDGAKLAVACKNHLYQYTVADDFKKPKQFIHHSDSIRALSWSPSGKYLASVSMRELIVWDTPQNYADISAPHKDYVNDLDWLDDNQLLSCGFDCFTKLWRVLW